MRTLHIEFTNGNRQRFSISCDDYKIFSITSEKNDKEYQKGLIDISVDVPENDYDGIINKLSNPLKNEVLNVVKNKLSLPKINMTSKAIIGVYIKRKYQKITPQDFEILLNYEYESQYLEMSEERSLDYFDTRDKYK